MENLSHIFISSNYLNFLPIEIKSNNEALYNHLINENISNYIDKEKVKAYFDSELYNLEEPLQKIENKYIFCQVISVRNIAISKEEAKYKEYDNLDEIEDEDNDFDDNKYLQGNDEKNQKTSKIIFKIEFSSTGDDLFSLPRASSAPTPSWAYPWLWPRLPPQNWACPCTAIWAAPTPMSCRFP